MKFLLASTLALFSLPLCAQTAGSSAAPAPAADTQAAQSAAMSSPVFSTLTPEEKTKLTTLHTQVIDQSPELKKEEMDLMQKGLAMQASGEPSDADKQSFMAQARAHADRVRTAMIKADPSVEAIFAKITAQAEKLQGQAQH